jgi:hypothetical protein
MKADQRASISSVKHVVAKVRGHDGISDEDRATLVAILEDVIAEMEREQEGAFS